MSDSSLVTKVAICATAAVASAGVLYYLFRKDEVAVAASGSEVSASEVKNQMQKLNPANVTVEDLLVIMDKITASQNAMKGVLKGITDQIKSADLDFIGAYNLVKERQPADPMEELGLDMDAFDQLLDKYQEDSRVLDSISRIMGPSEDDMAADDGRILSVQELIDIHRFMLEQLKQIATQMKAFPSADPRTATATAQVLVGARVEKDYKITSTAVERSVMVHQNQLAGNHEFATINMLMQQAMTELMGDESLRRE
jgi:hypothetical protein